MFVRTKDGVYEKETPNKDNDFLVEDETRILTTGGGLINKKSIINQSENLEELCDEFILIEPRDDGGKRYNHRDKKSFIEDYIGYEHIDIVLSYYTIYGAIWTDKGLIYVAKMNSEGKLELI